ncbi:GDP-mannose 4,6-dehydratase [uncultured archaeon]|nr:GDP-mannose 4,6-dehydratase [uncultured archaeon]
MMIDMGKTALITGISGQDGSYLAELLLQKKYTVFGTLKQESDKSRITPLLDRITVIDADMSREESLANAIKKSGAEEVYNFAAHSFPQSSWGSPVAVAEVTAMGVVRLLEAIRKTNPAIRFYQASTSELFGKATTPVQNENTPFHPRNPYGVAKLYGYWATVNYREQYHLHASNGIAFNHESPQRGLEYVTRKITRGVALIHAGLSGEIELGSLDARRDWGFAGDYCVDLDTSILTNEGFKYYDEIKTGDTVLNYNTKTNCLEQDKVIKKVLIKNKDKMYTFQGRGLKLRCSANHRIYYQRKSKSSKGGWSNWKICDAKDFYSIIKNLKLRTKYEFRLPHVQGYKNRGLEIKDDWFKLIGYLLSEGVLYDGNRSFRISVSQSKIINKDVYEDINRTLKNLGLVHRVRERSDGVVEFIFNTASSEKIISYFDSFDIHLMPKWIYKAGDGQLKLLFKAMMDGDGCWGTMRYVSKRKDLISSFQTIATILGYRTTIHQRKSGIWECTLIALRKKYMYITDCTEEDHNENVWCVTTENGTIVTNKDNGIAVSGNCKAMWLMLQQKNPDDYVIATGETHSVKDVVQTAFEAAGIKDWEKYVKIDKSLLRPPEKYTLCGDSSKARKVLDWKPEVSFKELIKMMVEADIKLVESKGN